MTDWHIFTAIFSVVCIAAMVVVYARYLPDSGSIERLPPGADPQLVRAHRYLTRALAWLHRLHTPLLFAQGFLLGRFYARLVMGKTFLAWHWWILDLLCLGYLLVSMLAILDGRDVNRKIIRIRTRES